ncbi:MAG: monovalent cation/H+ antiporter subunit A [Rhodanobacter sp.]|nr:MAG: monovalent cation/H+ antiporter subunit A [Rhodanobacter sp.]TAM10451.1 MAG: monovalent cation/H+ antiporter subunit A [Rhodanobacter sp.]TAM36298.1 MAG: monovalent cation/H+ antiporter subunit A [Rhodanobacter sp.]
MTLDAALPALLCLPFAGGLLAACMHRRAAATWLTMAVAAAGLLLTLGTWPAMAAGQVLRWTLPWVPALGLDLVLRVDGLAWLFLVLVFGIGLLVTAYARYYMPGEDRLSRLCALLLVFMGAMTGVVTAGNVIQLVFFWELTSLFSFLLIGYWNHGASAREGARTALIVTASGGLCLFAGMLLLGQVAGSYDLDTILGAGAAIRASAQYPVILALVALGALTKSAQFPFHFWLPQAMSAPTPVSAYLHSATMVKAGVFLLLRLWPVLAGTQAWFWAIGGAGLASLLLGAVAASFQRDLKAVLAYSTVSHLGLITMLLGLGNGLGAVAAIFHIVNHATFKASLFMAAGAVDHETGTRDLRRLGGLYRAMPITAGLAVVASAAMAGVPLLNGFLSKEMFFAVALTTTQGPVTDVVVATLAVVASAFSVLYSLRFVVGVFFGRARDALPRVPHEPLRWMRAPIGLLALACLLVGMLPAATIGAPLAAAAHAVLGAATPAYNLAVWHGWNAPLLMSAMALVGGCVGFVLLRNWLNRHDVPAWVERFDTRRLYERGLAWLTVDLPAALQPAFPARRLQVQLRLIVLVALIAAGAATWGATMRFGLAPSPVDPLFAGLWLLGGVGAIAAARRAKYHRLSALVLTGGVGLVLCVSFAWLSAPDLALTQLVVEAVTTIVLLLGLRWLPKRVDEHSTPTVRERVRRWRDGSLAVLAGGGLATLAYLAMRHPVADSASRFYLENAYAQGGGHNVVNVILVDFRGFDTLGEITVLVIVALSVFTLLRRFRPAPESIGVPRQQQLQAAVGHDDGVTPMVEDLRIPGLIIKWLAPVVVMLGVHLFLRGHDLPGGGFAAGVAVSVALIFLYMARGARWVEARLRVAPLRWAALGLLIASATGFGALAFGQPFLTSHARHLALPLLGELPLASAMLFDLGVFGAVVGATSLMLVALAHQSLRRPHRGDDPETS